jgi:hypothetical protein
MNLRKKYPYLVAWCRMMGSYDYYIQDQLQKAEETNAPHDCIYERDGVWKRYSEIKNPDAVARIDRLMGKE